MRLRALLCTQMNRTLALLMLWVLMER